MPNGDIPTGAPKKTTEPFAQFEEILPGWRKLFTEATERSQNLAAFRAKSEQKFADVSETYQQLQQLQQVIPGFKQMAPWTPTLEEARADFTAAQQEVAALMREEKRWNWRWGVLVFSTTDIKDNKANKVEDLYSFIDDEGRVVTYQPDASDRAFAEMVFNETKKTTKPVLEMTDEEISVFLAKKTRPKLVNMDDLTTSEILKVLSTRAMPELPEGLSVDQIRDFYASQDLPTEDLDEWLTGINEQKKAWITSLAAQELYIAGILSPEPIELSLLDRIKLAASSPFMAAAEAMDKFRSHFSMPIGGQFVMQVGKPFRGANDAPFRMPGWVPITGWTQWATGKLGKWSLDIEDNYNKLRHELDENWWVVGGQAYKEWDQNAALKFAIEVAVDPTTWIGFGVYPKLFGKVPFLSRLVTKLDFTVAHAFDTPFSWLRRVYREGFTPPKWVPKIGGRWVEAPRAAIQKARSVAGDNVKMIIAGAKITLQTTDPERITARALRETVNLGVKQYLKGPNTFAETVAAKIGKLVFDSADSWVDEAEIRPLMQIVESALDDVTPNIVNGVNDVYDLFLRKVLSDQEAAYMMLKELGARNVDDDAVKAIIAFMEDRIAKTAVKAKAIFSGTDPHKILESYYNKTVSNFLTNYDSAIATQRMYRTMTDVFLNQADVVVKKIWQNNIERKVILPMARHYLIMANYGPYNAIESVFRSALQGYKLLERAPAGFTARARVTRLASGIEDVVPESLIRPFGEIHSQIVAQSSSGQMLLNREGILPFWTKEVTVPKIIPKWLGGGKKIAPHWKFIRAGQRYDVGGVGSMLKWNNLWNTFGEEHRAFTWIQAYKEGLWRQFSKEMNQIDAAIVRANKEDFKTLSRYIKYYNRELELASIQGPEAIEDLKNLITKQAIQSKKLAFEIEETLARYDAIPETVKNTILSKISNGEINPSNFFELKEAMKAFVLEDSIMLHSHSRKLMQKWSNRVTSEVPENAEDVLNLVELLAEVHDENVIPRVIEEMRAATERRAIQLNNPHKIGDLWTEANLLTDDYMREVTKNLKEMHAHLSKYIKLLPAEKQQPVRNLLRNWMKDKNELFATRRLSNDILNTYATSVPGPQRTLEGWAEARAKADAVWQPYFNRSWRSKVRVETITDELVPGRDLPRITEEMIGEMRERLLPYHVASIYGSTSDDITRNLVYPETMTMMGRDRFINNVMGEFERAVQGLGRTLDDIGVTRGSVGSVYDTIMRDMSLDPQQVHQFTPMFTQMDDLEHEFNYAWSVMGVNDGEVEALKSVYTQTQRNLSELPMFREEAMPFGTRDISLANSMETTSVLRNKNKVTAYKFAVPAPTNVPPSEVERAIGGGITFEVADNYVAVGISGADEASGQTVFRKLVEMAEGKPIFTGRTSVKMKKMLQGMLKRRYITIRGATEADLRNIVGFTEKQVKRMSRLDRETKLLNMGDVVNITEEGEKYILSKPTIGEQDWWKANRKSAGEFATSEYYHMHTNYDQDTMFDAIAKSVYPFWNYEQQRWPWLARTFMRRPGVFAGWAKYMDYTEGGYMQVPGTHIQINPFRGTVGMGAFRRLWMQDYPEYYDTFPQASEILDYLSRFGFYGGFHVQLPLVAYGHLKGRAPWGELLPPMAKTGVNAFLAAFPGSKPAQLLRDIIFPENYRDYMIIDAVTGYGTDGRYVWDKRMEGIELTPEEEAAWTRATREVALDSIGMEQTGLFRRRNPQRAEAYEITNQLRSELTGVPVEMIERAHRLRAITGMRASDLYPLSPLQQNFLRENEIINKWSQQLYTPMKPSMEQEMDRRISQFWREVEDLREQARTEGFTGLGAVYTQVTGKDVPEEVHISYEWLDEKFRAGEITPRQFDDLVAELAKALRQAVDGIHQTDRYVRVPVTKDERLAWYKEKGTPPPMWHPAQELLWKYYELEPTKELNEELGIIEWDFDAYFAKVEYLINAIPEFLRPEFEAMIHRDWTPSRMLRWQDSQDYLRAHRNVFVKTLAQYDPAQQQLIKRYRAAPESVEARDIRETAMFDDNNKLIAHFNAQLKTIRENMRLLDPMLDAKLRFWGKVTTSLTPEAEELYKGLTKLYQPGR